MSSSAVIAVRDVSKSFAIAHRSQRAGTLKGAIAQRLSLGGRGRNTSERFRALDSVSFDVEAGERVAIIGANGAGKSTLLKIMCRVTLPESGTIEMRGSVGSLLEVGTGFHPDLTGRENVFLNGAILGLTRREVARRFDEIVEFAGIERFLDTPVKRYSSGMHVRLGFAVAAHLEPDILIVDEVLAVGDAAFQRKCIGKLEEAASQEGRTILFVSHSQAAVQELCSRVVLLENGRVEYDGPTREGMLRYLDLQDDQDTSSGEWDLSRRSNNYSPDQRPLITKLSLGTARDETGAFEVGGPVAVELVVESLPPCEDPWVGLRITSDLGQQLATFVGPLSDGKGSAPTESLVARLEVPELSLAPGNYRMDVGIVDVATNQTLDEVRAAGVMSLRHPELTADEFSARFGNGTLVIPGSWTVHD